MDLNHHRQSIRLKYYDYSQAGYYFVTMCTQNRECLFGDIKIGQMILNAAGKMIQDIQIDEYVIMPNHFHGIIGLVGAAPCGRPGVAHIDGQPRGDGYGGGDRNGNGNGCGNGQPHGVAPTLGHIMDWFKTMTTNDYIRNVKFNHWPPFPGRLWQRNYYEHIIREEDDFLRIKEYIRTNPSHWEDDEENIL